MFIVSDIREFPCIIVDDVYFETREEAEEFRQLCVKVEECKDWLFEIIELKPYARGGVR